MSLLVSPAFGSSHDWQEVEKQLFIQLDNDPKLALEQALEIAKKESYTPQNNREAWFILKEVEAHAQISLGDFTTAENIAEQLYQLHSAEQFPLYRTRALLLLAMLSERHNDAEKVFNYASEGLALVEQNNISDDLLTADLLSLISMSFRSQAKYAKALEYSKKSVELSHGDLAKQARDHNQIGVIYDYMGEVELALKHHELSLNIRRENNNQQGLSDSLYNIGEIYRDLGQYDSALLHFKQALLVDQSLGNPYHIANSHGKLGQVYLAMNELALAKLNITKGLEITRKMDAPSDTSWQLSNMARVYLAEKQLDKAWDVATEALTLALEAKAKRTEHTVRMALLDIAIAKKDKQAIRQQIELLLSMPNTGLLYQQRLHEINTQLYEESQEIEQAYLSLKKFVEVQQKLYAHLEEQQTERLKQNVEVVRQEQALDIMEKERALQKAKLDNLELQRKVVILAMLLLIGLLLMIYFRQMAKQRMANLMTRMLAANLEDKNQLLADVSHELRTPLAALKLSVELLEYNIEPDKDKAYARVHGKIAQLDNLIGDIYRSAQYDNNVMQLQKSDCDLVELLDDVVSDFDKRFKEKPQNLLVQRPSQAVICHVDPERFKQIIINLLNNSLNYTYENGTTQVSLEILEMEQQVKLCVSDSEPGLNSEELDKIFERLYRSEASRSKDLGGSGLGLAICRQIVLAHGGNITAQHAQLGGVEFTILLDMCE
ncbi:ATP-binding protein [Pseudoalteromonas sp. T1lg23B]|uniref:ATP-binding protein n=1 Tax=Pseudoalteromonas sp. T1lg23B TaxID=2077097 RepID=UPI001F2EE66F|nr:ATP-binding protein [Pseudoalteromonas sp. T1lg23B]